MITTACGDSDDCKATVAANFDYTDICYGNEVCEHVASFCLGDTDCYQNILNCGDDQ